MKVAVVISSPRFPLLSLPSLAAGFQELEITSPL
jgi:hypothetical protein